MRRGYSHCSGIKDRVGVVPAPLEDVSQGPVSRSGNRGITLPGLAGLGAAKSY